MEKIKRGFNIPVFAKRFKLSEVSFLMSASEDGENLKIIPILAKYDCEQKLCKYCNLYSGELKSIKFNKIANIEDVKSKCLIIMNDRLKNIPYKKYYIKDFIKEIYDEIYNEYLICSDRYPKELAEKIYNFNAKRFEYATIINRLLHTYELDNVEDLCITNDWLNNLCDIIQQVWAYKIEREKKYDNIVEEVSEYISQNPIIFEEDLQG